MIDARAVIAPDAKLAADVEVGPFAIIGPGVEIGPGAFHLAHAGALHASISSASGATVFLRGAVPEAGQLLG